MKKESIYYAIINDGEEKRVENWSKAEVLDWLRTIKHERMDLYEAITAAIIKESTNAAKQSESSSMKL